MKRVLLGMSGGTDSSVAAMLLQHAGYQVTGVTFRFWEENTPNTHLDDAARLARQLAIDHYAYDARELFRHEVVDYFIDEYMKGRTPVPCVKCNNQLKWRLLKEEADRLGIMHIATGHYVQLGQLGGYRCIRKGVDPDKDQSFFLWGLDQATLARALFPLGRMTKEEVRHYAALQGFPHVATKRDSIGVCFCPDDYRSFLLRHVDPHTFNEGNFVDEHGAVVGRHRGYPFYTVGQRRKLGVQYSHPVFVKSIDPATNTLVLSPLEGMYQNSFEIVQVRSIDFTTFAKPEPLICRIRYRKQATPCRVELSERGNTAVVRLLEPLESIAPGQSAVFYRDDAVVGGGIIR